MKQHILTALVCVLALASGMGLAQVTTGTISGTVKDSTGAVLPGAKVVLLNEDTGISRTVQSDSAGRYSASSLSLGGYRVTATQQGFQTQVRTGIVLTVAREAVVDLALSVGAVTQTVEVAGEAPAIETTNATISGLVSQEQIRDLPLNGRSFADLALLSPGVILNRNGGSDPSTGFGQRLSVNGSRADSNLFLIDGAVANNSADNSSTVAGLSLGVEGIREFRVLTHNFSAEYGRSSGAVLSLVTRSGTNQLHGSVYEFVRNNIFDARDFFNPSDLPAFRRNQFGASAGGPLIKDRIFFFANYEGLRQRQANTVISTVPDANVRQSATAVMKPYVNLYPLPNGRSFGDGSAQYAEDVSQPTTEDYSLERMDFRLGDKDNFYWRYIYDPSSDYKPRPVPIFASVDNGVNHYVSMGETHIFSGTALNEFRFSFSRTLLSGDLLSLKPVDPSLSFIPGLPFGTIRYTTTSSSTSGGTLSELGNSRSMPFSFLQNLFQETDTFSLVRGPHSLKFGADLERSQLNSQAGQNFLGTWQFGGLADLLAGNPSRLDGVVTNGITSRIRGYRRLLFGWFVQDDYRISSRLTLNLGLRHEFFTDPVEVNGRSANLRNLTDAATTVGPAFQAAKLNFAPRVGIAWDPTGSGKNSIRGGIGVYYNQVDSRFWHRLSSTESPFWAIFSLRNPTTFPRVPTNPPASAQAETTVQWHLATPTVLHFGLDVQRQVTSTMNLRVGYVGSHGYNMTRIGQMNYRIPTILPDGTKTFPNAGPVVNPNFASIEQLRADVEDNYNGLQVVLQKSAGAGLLFQGSYSYSKAMAMSDTSGNQQVQNVGSYVTLDVNDPARDYARSGYDQTHSFVFTSQYRLPWDHLLNNRLSKALLGGWTINGIWNYGSGLPLNTNLAFNNSQNGDPSTPDRPSLAPGASNNPIHGVTAGCELDRNTGRFIIPAGQLHTPDRWFDPCAFILPALGTFGNLGRDTIAGPNYNQVNFTLVKDTPLTESKKLEFRAEFFNLFNHPSFSFPQLQVFSSTRIHAGNEGVITATTSSGRQIQLGMKLTF